MLTGKIRFLQISLCASCLALFSAGCDLTERKQEKYQLVAAQSGDVYRIDKTSGKLWLIRGYSMWEIPKSDEEVHIKNKKFAENFLKEMEAEERKKTK